MVYVKNVPKNIILILTFIKIKMGLTINHPMAENFKDHLFWDTMNIVEAGENLWYGKNG